MYDRRAKQLQKAPIFNRTRDYFFPRKTRDWLLQKKKLETKNEWTQ
jgi:hypothetical protein